VMAVRNIVYRTVTETLIAGPAFCFISHSTVFVNGLGRQHRAPVCIIKVVMHVNVRFWEVFIFTAPTVARISVTADGSGSMICFDRNLLRRQ